VCVCVCVTVMRLSVVLALSSLYCDLSKLSIKQNIISKFNSFNFSASRNLLTFWIKVLTHRLILPRVCQLYLCDCVLQMLFYVNSFSTSSLFGCVTARVCMCTCVYVGSRSTCPHANSLNVLKVKSTCQ